ncbi:MAG TPA: NAD(P)-dependent alcohol dehydrogenase [Acidobacteriaceae bacterium]|nr:NAD(P)-dependent alcohol dehydrogenase [Acidobacteriaceae bacterium]
MKIWQISSFGIDHLELRDVPESKPGAGQVLIRVHAVSLNYRDLLTVKGQYNPRMRLPAIPCSDGAGEIVETGQGVSRFRAGDRVAGIFMQNWLDGRLTPERSRGALGGDIDGTLAEYVLLDEDGVVAIPGSLSYLEAATLPCAGVTAWNALVHAARVKAGDVAVIQGTGGVSIFALQFAKVHGAKVLGTSSSDEKLARAQALGLDAGVNYRQTPDWSAWVLDQTEKLGADMVIEVGGAGTLNQSIKAVRMGGVVAQIGVLSQTEEPLRIAPILHKQVQIKGIYVGSRAHFEEMNQAIGANSLHPVVDKVFAFDQAPAALRAMEGGSHFGKIVIQVVS